MSDLAHVYLAATNNATTLQKWPVLLEGYEQRIRHGQRVQYGREGEISVNRAATAGEWWILPLAVPMNPVDPELGTLDQLKTLQLVDGPLYFLPPEESEAGTPFQAWLMTEELVETELSYQTQEEDTGAYSYYRIEVVVRRATT